MSETTKNWNRYYWRSLKNSTKVDEKTIVSIYRKHLNVIENTMMELTPIKYGGLKFSHYTVIKPSPNGITASVGYVNKKHLRLDPSDPGYDKITNPELMEKLMDTERANDVMEISDTIYNEMNAIKSDMKEAFHKSRR